jgi:nucleoside-diphosphate-sugar epimerase
MRILVTGATGFIGSAFCRVARKAGHELAGLMLPTEQPPADLRGRQGLTWLAGSLAEPPWPGIESFHPEACVHFAWIATPGV